MVLIMRSSPEHKTNKEYGANYGSRRGDHHYQTQSASFSSHDQRPCQTAAPLGMPQTISGSVRVTALLLRKCIGTSLGPAYLVDDAGEHPRHGLSGWDDVRR